MLCIFIGVKLFKQDHQTCAIKALAFMTVGNESLLMI